VRVRQSPQVSAWHPSCRAKMWRWPQRMGGAMAQSDPSKALPESLRPRQLGLVSSVSGRVWLLEQRSCDPDASLRPSLAAKILLPDWQGQTEGEQGMQRSAHPPRPVPDLVRRPTHRHLGAFATMRMILPQRRRLGGFGHLPARPDRHGPRLSLGCQGWQRPWRSRRRRRCEAGGIAHPDRRSIPRSSCQTFMAWLAPIARRSVAVPQTPIGISAPFRAAR
jgi:hypothetical protein